MPFIAVTRWPLPAAPPSRQSASIRTALMKFRRALHATGAEEKLRTVPGTGVRVVEPAAPEDVPRQARRASIPIGLDLDPKTDLLPVSRRHCCALLSARGPVPRAELLLKLCEGRSPLAGADRVVRAKVTHLRRKLEAVGIPLGVMARYRASYVFDALRPPRS